MDNDNIEIQKLLASPNNMVIYIEEIPVLHRLFKKRIEKFRKEYDQFVISDPIIREDYRKLINVILEGDRKYRDTLRASNPELHGGSKNSICGGIGMQGVKEVAAVMLHYQQQKQTIKTDNQRTDNQRTDNQRTDNQQTDNEQTTNQTGGINPFFALKASDYLKSMSSGFSVSPFGMGSRSSYREQACTDEDYLLADELLYPDDEVPDPTDILKRLLSKNYVQDLENRGKKGADFIRETSSALDTASIALRVFDETQGGIFEKGGKIIAKTALSGVLAFVTAGAGGDNALAIPAVVAKGVTMISKLFMKLSKILMKLQKMIPAIKKGLAITSTIGDRISSGLDKVTTITSDIREGKNDRIEKINNQLRFLYNLFSIDFLGGPTFVKCRVEYVIRIYLENTGEGQSNEGAKSTLCLLDEIYQEVNKILLSLFGSVIDALVPNTMGLAGSLSQFLTYFSSGIYQKVRYEAEKKWHDMVDADIREGIQDPEMLKDIIRIKFDDLSQGLSETIISFLPLKGIDTADKAIDFIANAVNKGLGYMFLFVNVFTVFSEIDAGLQGKALKNALTDCPAVLEGMTKLAKKGIEISKGIKSKEDLKAFAKKESKKAIAKGKERGKQEIAKIKTEVKQKDERLEGEAKKIIEEKEAAKAAELAAQEASKETSTVPNKKTLIIKQYNEILDTEYDKILEEVANANNVSQTVLDRYKKDMQDYVVSKGANTKNMIRAEIEIYSENSPLSEAAPAAG